MAAANMTWQEPDNYESFYGEKSGLKEANTPGPLDAASKNDGVG